MGMLQEFKAFALKGNVVDMAVGIIIGGAFGKIVASLVKDVIMPPIGLLIGDIDFTQMKMTLKEGVAGVEPADGIEAVKKIDAVDLNYGMFINEVITFLIVAFAIFMMVKVMNSMKKKEEEKPAEAPKPTKDQELLVEIRDALRK
ncbi:MAG: large-conductance mechanosensitive channel protein MscL [Planctomycetota bacterium]